MQTNTIGGPQEPLTLDTLRRLMLKVPKKETWLSTRLYPGADALRVESADENFLVAHPSFWSALARKRREPPSHLLMPPFTIYGTDIIEIDPHPSDAEARRQYIADIWVRLFDAVRVAEVPLPDWLKAAPHFGKFG